MADRRIPPSRPLAHSARILIKLEPSLYSTAAKVDDADVEFKNRVADIPVEPGIRHISVGSTSFVGGFVPYLSIASAVGENETLEIVSARHTNKYGPTFFFKIRTISPEFTVVGIALAGESREELERESFPVSNKSNAVLKYAYNARRKVMRTWVIGDEVTRTAGAAIIFGVEVAKLRVGLDQVSRQTRQAIIQEEAETCRELVMDIPPGKCRNITTIWENQWQHWEMKVNVAGHMHTVPCRIARLTCRLEVDGS